MRTVAWLAVIALSVVLGTSSLAVAGPRRGAGSAVDPAQRVERIKRRVRAVRAYRLTEALALDDQTAGRLFPLLSRHDDEIDRMLEKRRDIQSRLGAGDSLRDPRAIDRLIEDALANQRAFRDLEEKRIADLRKILTPVQIMKLLVVLPAIDRQIQNQLNRAIIERQDTTIDGDDDLEPDERAPPKRPRRRREMPLAPPVAPSNAPGNTPPCDPSAAPCR